jgi:hypothetical protein
MNRVAMIGFIKDRLDSMSRRPETWTGSKESFILQLILLAEISHLGTPERFLDKQQAMLAELVGLGTDDSVTPEWASQAIIIARKYVMP